MRLVKTDDLIRRVFRVSVTHQMLNCASETGMFFHPFKISNYSQNRKFYKRVM